MFCWIKSGPFSNLNDVLENLNSQWCELNAASFHFATSISIFNIHKLLHMWNILGHRLVKWITYHFSALDRTHAYWCRSIFCIQQKSEKPEFLERIVSRRPTLSPTAQVSSSSPVSLFAAFHTRVILFSSVRATGHHSTIPFSSLLQCFVTVRRPKCPVPIHSNSVVTLRSFLQYVLIWDVFCPILLVVHRSPGVHIFRHDVKFKLHMSISYFFEVYGLSLHCWVELFLWFSCCGTFLWTSIHRKTCLFLK